MINFIAILGLIIGEAILIFSAISYFSNKANKTDEEVAERDKLLGERMEIIRKKNRKIKEQLLLIEDLKREIRELKITNNKRLR